MNSFASRLAVTAFGLLLAFGVLELFFRLLPASKPAIDFGRERPSFFYLPNNALTMQGNTASVNKSPDEYRIAVVGDSFTFGPAMQFNDTFPHRLQSLLQIASNVTVLNFGNPGFATAHEVTAFNKALRYHPDLILLQVTLNDPQLRPLQLEPEEVRGDFGPYQPHSFIARHSRFWSWVGSRIHNTRSINSYIGYHNGLWQENWDRFTKPFEEMRAQAQAAKIGFAVVIFPLLDFPLTRDGYPFREIHRRITGYVRQSGTPVLDLLGAYEGLDPYRLQLLPGRDSHPNEIAHRIAAEKIYWWMRRQPFFPNQRRLNRLYPRRSNVKEQRFPPRTQRPSTH